MGKIQLTAKAIRDSGKKVIAFNYCELQRLLTDLTPFEYSESSLGWDCDYYDIGNNIIISTGYRPTENTPIEMDTRRAILALEAHSNRDNAAQNRAQAVQLLLNDPYILGAYDNYISLSEYAKRNGVALSSARRKAASGGFDTARKIGRNWVIDANEPWKDRRYKE